MGEQTLTVKARGLYLTSNPLDAPPGALSRADNVVLRRPNVVEPRRGQALDTQLSGGTVNRAMAAFEGMVLAYLDNGSVVVRTAPGASTVVGTGYTNPDNNPLRFAEAGGGLYFTTTTGPQRMDSPTSTPVPAGTPPGLEGKAVVTGSSGWLANGETTGYRLVWGSRDGDGALLLGAPSGRFTVANSAGANRNTLVTAPIPSGIVAGTHFLQIYRTVIVATGSNDPGEDMAQVAEVFPTAAQVTAGVLTYTDVASFANGPTAYFSPSSGPGLEDSHEQPPLLTDAIQYKGYLFGVVQRYRESLLISLLAVGGTAGGLRDDEGIEFIDGTTDEIYLGDPNPLNEGARPTATKTYFYLDSTSPTASQQLENSVRSLVRTINGRSALIHAQYASGPNELPGRLVVTAINLGAAPIQVKGWRNAAAWTPAMVEEFDGTPARVGSTVTVTTAANYHHLTTGQTVTLTTGSADFPPGTKTITVTGNDTFTYTEAGAAVTGAEFAWRTSTDPLYLEQEAVPGSWATSTFQQPDAWPPRFRYQVGGPNTRLDRITAQGDALLFWTSDGLYRLTGETEDDFTLRPMDPTIQLAGTSTPATMGNKAFALTTQGVVSVTDLGVEKVSTPIDQALLPYYGSTQGNREILNGSAFGVAYQSENEYYLFLPNLDSETSLSPAMAYVFNTQTNTWARQTWEWDGVNVDGEEIMSGVENPADGYLYLGVGSVATQTWITRERKDRALTDYQDADGVGIPMDVAYQVETAKNPGALKQWSEVTAMLERPQPDSMEVYFTTEIATSEEGGTITSEGNSNLRTYLPLNMSRSSRLTVGFRHDAALEKPSILGLSVVYNTNSTRVGR